MKMSKADREAQYPKEIASDDDAPRYPYGLTIRLDEQALSKLGIEELPKTEAALMVMAKATVSSVSSHATAGGSTMRTVELQVTDLACEPFKAKKNTADALYKDRG